MASRSDQGVIPYKFDFVPKDLKVIKCSASTVNNNVTSKLSSEVPIFPIGGTKMQFLYCNAPNRPRLGIHIKPKKQKINDLKPL